MMMNTALRSVVTPARERVPGPRAPIVPLPLNQTPSTHKAPLWTWFMRLSVEERERVMCIEDSTAVTLLRQMYKKKATEGEGVLFFNVDDQPDPSAPPCFRKCSRLIHLCSYPEFLLRADRQLEDAIRVCDTCSYLDTITIEAGLLHDPNEIYRLLVSATRGGFLSEPCRVSWDGQLRRWVWQKQRWFVDMGFYSLATFIAHKLEQALWMRYWEATSIDPRMPTSTPKISAALGNKLLVHHAPIKFEYPKYHAGLLTKAHLYRFWHGATSADRKRIVGSLSDIVNEVLLSDEQANSSTASGLLLDGVEISIRPRSPLQVDAARAVRILKTLVDLTSAERSLEQLLFDLAPSSSNSSSSSLAVRLGRSQPEEVARRFIDVLYFSPLCIAGTPMDLVLRRIGKRVSSAYTESMSMDLILGEEAEAQAHQRGQGKGKKTAKGKKGKQGSQAHGRRDAAPARIRGEAHAHSHQHPTSPPVLMRKKSASSTNVAAAATVSVSATPVLSRKQAKKKEAEEKEKREVLEKELMEETKRKEAKDATVEETIEITPLERATDRSPTAARDSTEEHSDDNAKEGTDAAAIEAVQVQVQVQVHVQVHAEEFTNLHALAPEEADEVALTDATHAVQLQQRHQQHSGQSVPSPPLELEPIAQVLAVVYEDTHLPLSRSSTEASDEMSSFCETATPDAEDEHEESPAPRPRRLSLTLSSEHAHHRVGDTTSEESDSSTQPLGRRSTRSNDSGMPVTRGHTRTRSTDATDTERPRHPLSASLPGTPKASSMKHSATGRRKKKASVLQGGTQGGVGSGSVSSGSGGKRGADSKCSNPASKALSELAASAESSPRSTVELPLPSPEALRRRAFIVRLHDEILEFASVVKAMVHSKLMPRAEGMTRRVETLVRLLWPSASVRVYGSIGSHFALPSSDLDLVVIGARSAPDGTSAFEVLVRELKQQPWMYTPSFQPIASAKIPVIKLMSSVEKVNTDITFCDPLVAPAAAPPAAPILPSPHHGLRACDLVKSFALTYHPLVPLALVLKQLLYERGLSNTYGGGLSSYCLVLMIVSFLQTSVPQKECDRSFEKTHSKNLGDLLMKFLEFYGRRFAYQSTGITVTDGGKHFALGTGVSAWRTHGPPPLVILDPYDATNNIAASAFGMHRVRAAFDFSFAVLNTAADSAGEGLALSLVLRTWSMTTPNLPSQAGRAQRTPSLLGRDSTPLPHRPNFTS